MDNYLMTGFNSNGILHIAESRTSLTLCGEDNCMPPAYTVSLSRLYIIYHVLIEYVCKDCWRELDNKTVEKIQFDYIIYKLKG